MRVGLSVDGFKSELVLSCFFDLGASKELWLQICTHTCFIACTECFF